MAYKIQTAKETFDQVLSQVLAKLNTTVPSNNKAFNRVWSAITSTLITSLYKYANDSFKGLLVSTATRDQLIAIGYDYGIPIKAATNATLTVEISAYDGAEIAVSKEFVGDLNGLSYFPTEIVNATGATVEFNVVSQTTGVANNMSVDDTLTLVTPISGVGQTATVTAVVEDALDAEETEDYRTRLLYAKRNRGGGGNAYDYKRWAEEVTGVKRAFPITGLPYADESVALFLDGDMELAGTANWADGTGGNNIISKDNTVQFEGTQCLKIDPDGYGAGFVEQHSCLTVNQGYTIKGYCYFPTLDGVDYKDRLSVTGGAYQESVQITGTEWTYFEATIIADDVDIGFNRVSNNIFYLDYLILEPSLPMQRSVFIESTTDIDADGIAPQSLLDSVRQSINFDPITGYSRPPIGQADELLYVWPIVRSEVYVDVVGYTCDSSVTDQCKAQIEADLDTYLRSCYFYNPALDSEFDRRDIISTGLLSSIVSSVMLNYGATFTDVTFYIGITGSPVVRYVLAPGELLKLEDIDFV